MSVYRVRCRSVAPKPVSFGEVEVLPALGLGLESTDTVHELCELESLFGNLGEIEAWRRDYAYHVVLAQFLLLRHLHVQSRCSSLVGVGPGNRFIERSHDRAVDVRVSGAK